jgi:hypothetical protein
MSQFEKIKDRMLAIEAELFQRGEELILEVFSDFFQKYPNVLEVRWSQYTPYFNDGDTCDFSANDFFGLSQKELDDEKNGDFNFIEDCWDIKQDALLKKELAEIRNLLGYNDLLKTMLGDHLIVKVTPTKVSKERFDEHD